jgi:3-oxoacyl-[acyl-carrier-protein] synthase-3
MAIRGSASTATESFSLLIREAVAASGWKPDDTRWVIPHEANGRILKAAAKRSDIPFDRSFMNVENVGNTSSASIPLALTDVQRSLRPDDKLILCSVGAGLTTAAISVEWQTVASRSSFRPVVGRGESGLWL